MTIRAALAKLFLALALRSDTQTVLAYVRRRCLSLDPEPRPIRTAFFDLADNENLTIEGEIITMQLKEGQRVRIAVALKTRRGNLAKFQDGSASFVSSDPSVATVTQNPNNPLEATVEGVDGSENESVLIEFRADGDPGEGVRDIIATLPVTVTQGDAFVAEIGVDPVEDSDGSDPYSTLPPAGEPGGPIVGNPAAEEPDVPAGGEPTPPETPGGPIEPADPTVPGGPAEPTTGNEPTPATGDAPTTGDDVSTSTPPTSTDTPSTDDIDPQTGEPIGADPGGSTIPANDGPATTEPTLPADTSTDPDRAETPDLTSTPANPFDSESKPGDANPAPAPTDIPPHDKSPEEARPLPVENPGREAGVGDPKPLTDERPVGETAEQSQPGTDPNNVG